MQLVAASKMKKAQDQALAGRRYAEEMNKVLVNLKEGRRTDEHHPLFEEREGNRELMIVITTDKGLCGGLNTNLLRKVSDESSSADTKFATVGNKGKQALARLSEDLVARLRGQRSGRLLRGPRRSPSSPPRSSSRASIDTVKASRSPISSTPSARSPTSRRSPMSPIDLTQKKAYEGVGESDD